MVKYWISLPWALEVFLNYKLVRANSLHLYMYLEFYRQNRQQTFSMQAGFFKFKLRALSSLVENAVNCPVSQGNSKVTVTGKSTFYR